MKQLALTLQPKATRPRDLPITERLQAIVKRKGIEIFQRSGPCQKGAVLVPPYLARPHGAWELQCASPAWCQTWPWSRYGYSERIGKRNQRGAAQ